MTIIRPQVDKAVYYLWFVASLFYFFQYIIRVIPSVTMNDVIADYQMSTHQLATYSAAFPLAYSIVQIPAGFLSDRMGVRITSIVALLLCIVGALVAAFWHSYYGIACARIIMGIGGGASFVVALKISSDNFGPSQRGFFMGMTACMGLFGAFLCNHPSFLSFVHLYGLQFLYLVIAMAGSFLIILLMFDFAKEHVVPLSGMGLGGIVDGCYQIMNNRALSKYILFITTGYMSISVLFDLWGNVFLRVTYDLSAVDASSVNGLGYVGSMIGGLVLPTLFGRFNQSITGIIICTLSIFVLWSVLLSGWLGDVSYVKLCYFALGCASGLEILAYACASVYTNSSNSGAMISVFNTINSLLTSIFMYVVGIGASIVGDGGNDGAVDVFTVDQVFYGLLPSLVFLFVMCGVSLSLIKHRKPFVPVGDE